MFCDDPKCKLLLDVSAHEKCRGVLVAEDVHGSFIPKFPKDKEGGGHNPQLGQPRFAKWSAVQSRFWIARQAKTLIFGGAQIFHVSVFIIVNLALKNRALYTKAAEYWSFAESFQTMSSSI